MGRSGLSARLDTARIVWFGPAFHFTAMPADAPEGPAILAAGNDDPVCTDPPEPDRTTVHGKNVTLTAEEPRLWDRPAPPPLGISRRRCHLQGHLQGTAAGGAADMAKAAVFWNRMAKRYARSPISDQAAYERKLDQTRALLRPDMQVLEVGCGTGTTALHHAPHVAHIRATDLSPAMLEIARGKAAEAGVSNVTFEEAAVEDLASEGAGYDLVMAHSLLHLLEDRDAGLAVLARLTRPDGWLVTSTVCMADTAAWLRPLVPLGQAIGLLPVLRFFDRAALEDSHRAAGFTIEDSWRPKPRAAVFVVARRR